MCLIGNWLLFVAFLAPPSVNDLSPLERQTANFYGAIGNAVRATWSVEPKVFTVGQDITLKLRIEGVVNPTEVRAPELALLNLDPRDFQALDETIIQDLTPIGLEFSYRVRAKLAGEFTLPELPFVYYHPIRVEGKRFVTTYAESMPFRVEAEVPKAAQTKPKKALPAKLAGPFVAGWSLPHLSWLVSVALFFPGIWLTNKLVKRWMPDEAKQKNRLRIATIRNAEVSLRRAAKSPEPILGIEKVLLSFPLDHASEIQERKLTQLLRRCQEARFSSQHNNSGQGLLEDALVLLRELKGPA